MLQRCCCCFNTAQGVKVLPEPESVMKMLQNSKYMLVLVPVSKGEGEGSHQEQGPPGGSLEQERRVEVS